MTYQGVVAFLKKNNATRMDFIKEPNKDEVFFKLDNREKTTGLIDNYLQRRILSGEKLSIDSVAVAVIPDQESGGEKYELRYMGVITPIKYVIFDTETTGLPKDFNAPSSEVDNWPRMIQLSWINIDKEGNTIKENNHIIYPNGFIIPDKISSLTGITNELAMAKGEPIEQVLKAFIDNVENAEAIVGHNVSFDISVVSAELIRLGKEDTIKSKPSICTMKSTVDYCAIPGRNGFNYPKLQDLHKKLFGCFFQDAHDAFSDTKATRDCFLELKKKGLIHEIETVITKNKSIDKEPSFKSDNTAEKPIHKDEGDSYAVDGIKLDPDNHEFQYALQFALESNRNLYLTGKAGSGKTTFLKYLRKISKKKMAVLAPTGVAAINAGGQTIHSFFKIAPSIYVPGDKRLRVKAPEGDSDRATIFDYFKYSQNRIEMLRDLELLVIDEVSMVRSDLIDVIDTLLRVFRKNSAPFGGVQMILIGDTYQLPPVVGEEERDLLYRFYESEFFFSSRVIQRSKPLYIELKKIYRQNEQNFIDLLNRVREGQMIPDDFRALNAKYIPGFRPKEIDNYIILSTTNDVVSGINARKLEELKSPIKTYVAKIEGDFPDNSRPTDTELRLKVGTQVMFLKNNGGKGYYNGLIGVIIELGEKQVKVAVDEGKVERRVVTAELETWDNKIYRWDEKEKQIVEKVVGLFTQLPLRLAWAITVHKSQGLTFDKVIADVGGAFASGQVYVALSRCTSMNGLVLTSPIYQRSVITDPRVIAFAKSETPETLLTEQLSGSKADYYYSEARKAFRRLDVSGMLDNFHTALLYRNDVDTDTFRRYVSTWTSRLFSSLSTVRMLQDSIEEKNKHLEEYRNRIDSLEAVVSKNALDLLELEGKLQSEKGKADTLKTQNTTLSDSIKSLLVNAEETKKQLKRNVIIIGELEDKITLQEKEIEYKAEQVRSLEDEIVRLKNIKWYQKLLGKQ